jgi:hypothetical protein
MAHARFPDPGSFALDEEMRAHFCCQAKAQADDAGGADRLAPFNAWTAAFFVVR